MTVLEDFEVSRVDAFFKKVTGRFEPSAETMAMVITHLLPERPAFLRAVARAASIAAVLPKPKSINAGALREITGLMPVAELDRAAFADPDHALSVLEDRAAGRDVVLLDVGGYFAPSLEHVCARFSGRIVGVVEDTENGHQRYAALDKLPCPVFSVARSPLKDPEDYLVGQSVTFSAEALIRSRGDILQGRAATVIGYGKLGRSVAAMLHAKHVAVTVYDRDPVKRLQALSQGYRAAPALAQALAGSGLIVCATGNLALKEDDFAAIANGAYIASVTSSDDELELAALNELYGRTPAGEHITRYARTGHFFYVLADGNAVNFLHGACVGAFIFLVQAEILAALATLASAGHEPGLHELDKTTRSFIASTWLRYFDGAPS
ncbi:adenosylhomocysteinase [Microtetraspora sp. NBRC 13810]|uniref:NAD(P)-binding domain-containing protein n=1 Tax=Microtetraspora sp. NBRC 13810 TaxID=3030990 RepID=UPI0024A47D9E|nr:NAD(P)-dependent oxidoreductase [Microtetraspora sp. NBRC 13810]GLW09505.1 adenosylhomocysteinase [Microtetraspora sp. NBRC 13810]